MATHGMDLSSLRNIMRDAEIDLLGRKQSGKTTPVFEKPVISAAVLTEITGRKGLDATAMTAAILAEIPDEHHPRAERIVRSLVFAATALAPKQPA